MDTVARLTNEGILEIVDVLGPTSIAFEELLKKNLPKIKEVKRETFQYGNENRHKLDVYYPPAPQSGKTPLVFWIYGGGFVAGGRVSPPLNLTYTNIGAFFARQGFVTIVPDYRLASPPWLAEYPRPVEDIRDAISWVISNVEQLISPTTPNPDINSIFAIGHSAGGTHLGSLIFGTEVMPIDSPIRPRIKGVVLFAGLYYNDPRSKLEPEMQLYYGDKLETHSVKALLQSAKSKGLTPVHLPKVLFAEGEHETRAFKDIRKNFQQDLTSFLQQPVPLFVAEKHNHISIMYAPCSGEGEDWAFKVSEWFRTAL